MPETRAVPEIRAVPETRAATDKRYVLCRPVAGLNDTLCQIEMCRAYAARYRRILIVDGRYSGVLGEFGNFFQMDGNGHIFDMTVADMPDIDALDCYPYEVAGRVSSVRWKPHPVPGKAVSVDFETDVPLTFPFDCDHPETLLLHQQAGGGRLSFALLDRLTLVPRLAKRARNFISRLPRGYSALHIRNTDYKTDVDMVVAAIRDKVAGQDLLLCSDDASVFPAVQAGLPQTRIVQISAPVFDDGRPQHVKARLRGGILRHRVAVDSIVDLCALAAATTLYVPVLHSKPMGGRTIMYAGKNRLSGFSKLAAYLGEDKSRLRRLLGEAGVGMLPRLRHGTIELIEPPDAPPEV